MQSGKGNKQRTGKFMNIQLPYGHGKLPLNVPRFASFPDYYEPQFDIDRDTFQADLFSLLPRNKGKYRNVAIVVSDKTRLCGYPQYLPWLVEALMQQGADKNNISFFIAYGTHPRQSEEECRSSYGKVYDEFHFEHHDSRDDSLFEFQGTTKRGTPVRIRRDILAATLLITFGAISHHYFAGYGGGRKLLFPGLGERNSIYHNHGLFLDRDKQSLASGCQPGKLKGNPLAEDLQEVDTHMPSRIAIHGILNTSGRVCRLMVAKSYTGFKAACKVHDSFYRVKSVSQFDLVVASSGGYPKDINFIQAHKSVHHAAAFVKPGGSLVMLSECTDKIGSDYFLQFLEAGSYEAAFSILAKKYEGNGGTALSMLEKTKRIRIYMLTTLSSEICRILQVKKVTVPEIDDMLASEKGTIAIIKNASILVK